MAFLANQGTQTAILTTLIGGTETGIVRLDVGVGTTRADFGGTITTVDKLTNGSINILTGTVTQVTTVANLTNGSINILTGTLNSLPQVSVGTIPQVSVGTLPTLNLTTGTITSVTNLAGGTVRIDPTSVATPLTFGTLGTAGGSFFATISAASGAGTKHYISGLQVVGQAGTVDVRVLAGTAIQGTGVLGAGICVPAGGFARDFSHDFQTGTNSELTYHFVGAGTAFITVNFWKGA